MRIFVLIVVPLFAACAPSCPEQTCSTDSDCLQGFACTHGACALPVSCGQVPGCPPDGYPDGWNDCLWTGCNCYANDHIPLPPPVCTCTTDAAAQDQGYAWCDESIDQCTSVPQPPASCGGTATCTTNPPACTAGSIPALRDGCYTGECRALAGCDVPPPCAVLAFESDCTARADCEPVYQGSDCQDPSGAPCTPGDAQCTCKTYEFTSCRAR